MKEIKELFRQKNLHVRECVLALDIDGTVTDSQKKVTPEVKCALRKYRQLGGQIILASGRPVEGVLPIAESLEMFQYGGYILAYNGGCVREVRMGKEIFSAALPQKAIAMLAQQARQYGVNLITYEDNMLITENPEDIYCREESFINHMMIKKVSSLADYVTFPVIKCLMTGDADHLEKVERELREYWDGQLSVFRSEPFFLEITAEGINKASILDRILPAIGRDRKNLIACGDGYNDITMLRYAEIGVAMDNAAQIVKEAADCIAPSNDEDGVAFVVRCLSEADNQTEYSEITK